VPPGWFSARQNRIQLPLVKIDRVCPMRGGKITFGLLILAGMVAWMAPARAQLPPPPPEASPAPAAGQFAPSPPSVPPAPAAAQPGQADAAQEVGSVASLQGSAFVRRATAVTPLKISDPVFKGDILQTGLNGTIGITLDDETTFTLQPNSRIAVDDFVYQAGASGNQGVFNIISGTVAFLAAQIAKTGDMKIETPTSTLGIRGTTGLIEIPAGATPGTTGEVSIKLYADADGRVGRIEVFGRDGSQLGLLTRAATGFAIRPGATGAAARFSAVALRISPQEAERDRGFVRQAFSAQQVGRQINIQRRNFRQQQRNQQRPGQPGQRGGFQQQRPGQFGRPGGQPNPRRAPPRRGERR
jgi:hypothetical protein